MTELSRRTRDALLVLWSSFLAAAVVAACVFAFVDPANLPIVDASAVAAHRRTIYALGFLIFWATGAGAAVLALWLGGPADDTAGRQR